MSLIDDTLADQLEASLAGLPARTPLDPRDADPTPERDPDDFKRRDDGTPFVSDPTGATVKTGPRKGQPCWVLYGRPSSFGKQIENTTNLDKWSERRIVLGLANMGEAGAEMLRRFYGEDPESKAWEKDADRLIRRARKAGKALEAGERGTHGHLLTDDAEQAQGDDREGPSWVTLAEAGVELGLPVEVQAAMVEAWRTMLVSYGFEILASEAKVVSDRYRQAGSLDRLVRLTRSLTFQLIDREVTLPAGLVIVLDTKTGRLRRAKDGGPSYWHGYAVQIAAYADAVPYNTRTETRGAWEFDISQEHAIIAHLPVDEALAGEAVCRLVYVDIAKGHGAAALCLAAKQWENDRSAFGYLVCGHANCDDPHPGGEVRVPVVAWTQDASGEPPVAADGLPANPEFEVDPDDELRATLRQQCAELTDVEKAHVLGEVEARGLLSLKQPRTADELGPWADLLREVFAARRAAVVGETDQRAAAIERKPYQVPLVVERPAVPELAVRFDRAEGGEADPDAIAALQAAYGKLGPAKAWVNAIIGDARAHGFELSMSLTAPGGARTLRRFELMRGLVALAASEQNGNATDSVVRGLAEAVLATDAAQHPAVAIGQVVGVMGPDEARAFAVLATQMADGDLAVVIENAGAADELVRVVRP